MRLIKPSFELLNPVNEINSIYQRIESAGRTAYKSEARITPDSAPPFVKAILKRGHESVIEHCSLSARIVCDRGVSHELVRHRLTAITQESTRYCNYTKGKFDNQLTLIIPIWMPNLKVGVYKVKDWGKLDPQIIGPIDKSLPVEVKKWLLAMLMLEKEYEYLVEVKGWSPQQARSILPNSLKTELVITANIREWRHIMRLRTASDAHPQAREVMTMGLGQLQDKLPVLFNDIVAG